MISTRTQKIQGIVILVFPILLIVLFAIIRHNIILPKTKYNKIEKYYSGSLKNKPNYNDYTYKYINNEDLIDRIFNEYKNMLIDNPKSAYKYINKKEKTTLFNNYDEFEKFINNNKNKIVSSNLKKYSSSENTFKILDQYDYKYTFEYTNPVKYKVNIEIYKQL